MRSLNSDGILKNKKKVGTLELYVLRSSSPSQSGWKILMCCHLRENEMVDSTSTKEVPKQREEAKRRR